MGDKAEDPGEAWDRVASEYNQATFKFTRLHAFDLLCSISDHLRAAKTVLDVACGSGAVFAAYLKLFPQGIPGQTFIMTDISPKMVSGAEKNVQNMLPSTFHTEVQFRTEDGKNLKSVPSSSVDVLCSCFGIFLIPDRDAVFNEIKRVLKPGGIVGTTAWTDMPSEMDFKTAGFGAEFQATIGEAFSALVEPGLDSKPAPWKAWADPDVVRKIFDDASFGKIKVHRVAHSTSFQNFKELWYTVTKTSPFVDTSKIEPNKLEEVKKRLWDGVGVQNEDDRVFVIMSSNVVIATL